MVIIFVLLECEFHPVCDAPQPGWIPLKAFSLANLVAGSCEFGYPATKKLNINSKKRTTSVAFYYLK